eukprot:TRINITY_DN17446_c0_g1_i1.p1 TRINITY_DN17446_c0_g1~~TRINITY_DN17446_c0_g1_i1.p1  ORF type:complete len:135 (-),score=15.97 TRINITY_DN17446_c0_g1_i1:1581-1985(-)
MITADRESARQRLQVELLLSSMVRVRDWNYTSGINSCCSEAKIQELPGAVSQANGLAKGVLSRSTRDNSACAASLMARPADKDNDKDLCRWYRPWRFCQAWQHVLAVPWQEVMLRLSRLGRGLQKIQDSVKPTN